MKAAFIAIGCLLAAGGLAAVARPGPTTVFPSGSMWKHPVTLSADLKKLYGYASIALGVAAVLLAVRTKPSSMGTTSDEERES